MQNIVWTLKLEDFSMLKACLLWYSSPKLIISHEFWLNTKKSNVTGISERYGRNDIYMESTNEMDASNHWTGRIIG
jgi:hypothetical protein